MKSILENKKYIFIFCAPALLLFGMFVLYPLIHIFIMAFQKYDGLNPAKFIGWDNFIKIFQDSSFIKANLISIGLCFFAIIGDAILGIGFAIIISQFKVSVQRIYRTAFLIPFILSITVIAQLWLAIYHADWGLLNTFLKAIGLEKWTNEWLINERTAMICVAIVGMWWIFGMIVLLAFAGLKSIPETYYEAAKIDGANFMQSVRYITLPLLNDVICICLILSAVGGLYTFPQVYIMTGGGPGDITQTVMMYMYKQVFSNQRFGLGASVAVIAIIETFIIILGIKRLMKREKVEY